MTNRYVLGAKPRIRVTPRDTNGVIFVPSEIRLSIKEPTGSVITYSGGALTTASGGSLFTLYRPPVVGWYQTETWVKDGNGLEDTATDGFEVYDLVYTDPEAAIVNVGPGDDGGGPAYDFSSLSLIADPTLATPESNANAINALLTILGVT